MYWITELIKLTVIVYAVDRLCDWLKDSNQEEEE